MKKALCMILALTMIFSLVGCGKSEDEKTFKTKKDDVIEPYLDEEGNFVSSLSEFVVEPDKYFPKSTVETNSEDDGSRIMVYVEFCTQEEIDTYAEKAKGERFVKMSYSDTDGKMWDDSKGWYSFAVMTEESGDDDQPLNCLFIYLINSDFAYDLKHPKVEETPVPTVDPTPEPTPEPTQESEIRWDVIMENYYITSYKEPNFSNDKIEQLYNHFNNLILDDIVKEANENDYRNTDKMSFIVAYTTIVLKCLNNETFLTKEESLSAIEIIKALFFEAFSETTGLRLNEDLTNDELEILDNVLKGTEVISKK